MQARSALPSEYPAAPIHSCCIPAVNNLEFKPFVPALSPRPPAAPGFVCTCRSPHVQFTQPQNAVLHFTAFCGKITLPDSSPKEGGASAAVKEPHQNAGHGVFHGSRRAMQPAIFSSLPRNTPCPAFWILMLCRAPAYYAPNTAPYARFLAKKVCSTAAHSSSRTPPTAGTVCRNA